MEAQGKGDKLRVRTYSASAHCQKDIENLSKIGLNDSEIARVLDVSPLMVRKYEARIQREKTQRQKFLMSGQLPWLSSRNEGYLAILQQ
jgi:hypothetical protein